MRDVLTEDDLNDLVQTYVLVDGVRTPMGYTPVITPQALQRAARLGAERAMQAPDGDLPAMLDQLPRLKDWCAIGPAQRAEVDTLVAWVRAREREGERESAINRCKRTAQEWTNNFAVTHGIRKAIEAIRRGEEG